MPWKITPKAAVLKLGSTSVRRSIELFSSFGSCLHCIRIVGKFRRGIYFLMNPGDWNGKNFDNHDFTIICPRCNIG